MSTHADALAQSKQLEEVSDANLIHFFKLELIGIGEGGRAADLLPASVIQNLVRIGVLEYLRGRVRYSLTDKAMDILKGLR